MTTDELYYFSLDDSVSNPQVFMPLNENVVALFAIFLYRRRVNYFFLDTSNNPIYDMLIAKPPVTESVRLALVF